MPPPLPMPPVACAAMHVPMHFPGPPSPQAPTAAIDLAEDREDKLWLKRLVEGLRAENAKIMDELTAERRHMNAELAETRRHMNAELAEARAENRRLTAQHAEQLVGVRLEAATAAWRNDSWYNNRWWGGPQ